MAIKYTSLETSGLTIPNSNQYISINGGWTAAPTGGGIITFSGSAVRVVPNDLNIEVYSQPGELLDLGDLGTFFITSYSIDDYIGYTKITYSITCILGYLTKISPSVPLAACIYQDKTVNDVLLAINLYLGITFALPRASTFRLHEPVWLKENQSLISLLNEILLATGCIIYSVDGQNILCKTIADFYEGLSGDSNSNTISGNFVVNTKGSEIRFIELSGTKTIKEPLENVSVSTITNNNTNLTITTTIERTFPQFGRSGQRRIITEVDDRINGTKTITTEIYENAIEYTTRIVDVPISECVPYDPARILSRVTEEYLDYGLWVVRNVYPVIDQIMGYSGISDSYKPLLFLLGFNFPFIISRITENWIYNTNEPQIVTNPDTYIPSEESVNYSKVTEKRLLTEGAVYFDDTYGQRFNLVDEDIGENGNPGNNQLEFMQLLHANFIRRMYTFSEVEKTETNWIKSAGSYIWNSVTYNYESMAKIGFESRKAKMKTFANRYLNESDLRLNIFSGIGFTHQNIFEWSAFKTNFSLLSSYLWNSMSGLILISTEKKESEPSFSTFPSPYRIHNIPWQNREIFNNGIIGETLSLNSGRFSDFSTLRTVAREIKNAKDQRIKSLSVTNINELFRVGEIDAPSFSISVDGLKSSGVYLNG